MARQTTKQHLFFSLKWKTVAAFSLVLVIVNAGLAWYGHQQLNEQFKLHLSQNIIHQDEQLHAISENNLEELRLLASFISTTAGLIPKNIPFDQRLKAVFDNHGANFEFDWELDEARYFSNESQLLYSWKLNASNDHIVQIIKQVNDDETPAAGFDCSSQCFQYIAIPVLDDGRKNGVLLLGRSISQLVIAFNETTGADIGLLTKTMSQVAQNDLHQLNHWQYRIQALTNYDKNVSLLQKIAEQYPFVHFYNQHQVISHAGRHINLRAVDTNDPNGFIEMRFIIIGDFTKEMGHIEQASKTSLQIGVFGFLISEALLLLLLWRPLNRLVNLAKSLPLLANNEYAQLRSQIGDARNNLFKDEIELTHETAVRLSYTLESLHRDIDERTREIIERSNELQQERDFVNGLFDNAPIIILTQDPSGKICTLNTLGESYFANPDHQAGPDDMTFATIIEADKNSRRHIQNINRLVHGGINLYKHQSHQTNDEGVTLTISWIHSRLHSEAVDGKPAILSVGLDITERLEAKQQLSWLSDHDHLTDLYNRRYLLQSLPDMISRSIKNNRNGAIMFINLDHFKEINDTSGHPVGDAMLRMSAEKILEQTRSSDLVARIGGDEFAIVMQECNKEGAQQLSQRIINGIRATSLNIGEHNLRVTASIGIVLYPEHGTELDELVALADLSMLQAKKNGRDRWHLFTMDEKMRDEMKDRITWKDRIEQALISHDFILYFQPIQHIETQRVSHYEVLIRLREADGSIVAPGAFIPIAERTGQIHAIDQYVLKESIDIMTRLNQQNNDEQFNLSINLSGRVMDNADLLPFLKQLLSEKNVDPKRLIFELTETAALADIGAAELLMKELQAMGCRFAMDDFGVGFSSFHYLRELPLDIVKIDGSFIRNLSASQKDQLFVKSLTDMAHGLDKTVIAEFVEDEQTLELLKEIGVDYAQGYHLGKPSPHLPGMVESPETSLS